MYTGLIHLHSLLRWVAIIAIIVAMVNAFLGMRHNRPYGKNDNLWSLITMITFHIQLVIGLILYFTENWHTQMGNMSDKIVRFFAVEHLVGMLVVIILITVGRARAKRSSTDLLKHRRTLRFFLIAFIILMFTIPWPTRDVGIGRGWFPGL